LSRAPRELAVRPGASFTCHGDGLCCTDIHQLGPVSAREAPALEALEAGVVVRLGGLRLLRLHDTHRQGGCAFLEPDLRCRIHAAPARPRSCHRFPYALVRTPDGARVATDHRCPCRSLGERAPLDPEKARAALVDTSGRLSADRRVEGRIPVSGRSRIGWARYLSLEAALLGELAGASAARRVEDILGVEPFPALEGRSWEQVGIELASETRASRWGEAFRLFGRTLAWLHAPPDERPPRLTFAPRLWAEAFDRAERRTAFDAARADDAIERMYADFAADVLWALEWPLFHDLAQLRLELASRLAVARTFARALVAAGHRPDRAAAESLAMIEVVGVSPSWLALAASLRS
jgi:Fe-S-cluster containining protein